MQTTTILSELLVIGLISMSWLLPILNKVIDLKPLLSLSNDKGVILFFFLILLYFLGIFFNNISDIAFYFYDKWLSKKYGGKEKLQKIRLQIIVKSELGANYLFRKRSFVRILRSASLNLVLIIIYLLFDSDTFTKVFHSSFISTIVTLVIIFFITFYLYSRALNGYFSIILGLDKEIK